MKRLRDIFLFLGLSTLPVYIFPSGLPQPSHMFLCLFFLCSMIDGKITLKAEDWFLGMLFLFTLTRESIAVLGGAAIASLVHPLFTLFNLLIIVFVRKYFQQAQPYRFLCFICGISLAGLIASVGILASGVSVFGNDTIARATGSFNNPNQMAYFSVCLGAIALTLYLAGQIRIRLAILLIAIGLLLVLSALSKAGLIGFALVLLIFTLSAAHRAHWCISAIAFILIPVITVYTLTSGYFEQAYALQRLYGIGDDGDDTLYQRGYLMLRYFNTPFEIAFGLGTDRVQNILTHEVHSTLMYNLVNYGLIGFLLYTGFLFVWAKLLVQGFGAFAALGIIGAPMLYGLAHNGTRFTIFYVLITSGLSLSRNAGLNVGAQKKFGSVQQFHNCANDYFYINPK